MRSTGLGGIAGVLVAVLLLLAAPAAALDGSDVNFGFIDTNASKLIGMTWDVTQQQIVPFTILSGAQGLDNPQSFSLDLTDNAPAANDVHGVIADPGAAKVFVADIDGSNSVVASSFELLSQPWSVAVSPNEVEDADYYVTDAGPSAPLKVIRIIRPQNYIQVLAQSSSGIKKPTKIISVPNACAGGSLLGGDLVVLDTDSGDPAVWRLSGPSLTTITKLMDSSVLDDPVDMDLACDHAGPTAIANGTVIVADNTSASGLIFRGVPALPDSSPVRLPPADGQADPPMALASAFMIDNYSFGAGFVPQDVVFTEPDLGMLVGYVIGTSLATIIASGTDGLVSPNDVLVNPYIAPGGGNDHLYVVTDSAGKVITVRPSTGEVKLVADSSVGISQPRDPQTLQDDDGDKVADILDNCPPASCGVPADCANPDQADLDGDGAGDVCDADKDGDGIANGADNCPSVPNADQSNLDADAFGDACDCDADNDTWCKEIQTDCEPGSMAGCTGPKSKDCADDKTQCAGHIGPPATCGRTFLAQIPVEDPPGSGTFVDRCNLIGGGDGLDQDCDDTIDEDCSGGTCATLATREAGSASPAGVTGGGVAWEYALLLGVVAAVVFDMGARRRRGRR